MTCEFQTFDITRLIAARPETVFRLWTDARLKEEWFCWNGNGWTHDTYDADLIEGGFERVRFTHPEVGSFRYESHLFHVLPASRLIYGYTMLGNTGPISVSQATVTIEPTEGGAQATYTEQVVFLDGGDSLDTRLPGCVAVMDRMKDHAEASNDD